MNAAGAGAAHAVEATALRKTYPGVQALQGIDFRVAAGEVRALIGKNGAGKSTLVKILSGAQTPDAGMLQVGGRTVDVFTPGRANALGVATVHQELSLVPELSVAENILLGRWHAQGRGGFIDHTALQRQAAAVLAEFGVQVDPAAKVRTLSIAEQQLVEIARGLSFKPKVLILDEPTSSLPATEVDLLLRTIRMLSDRGVSVIYVSHRMDEIQQIAHSVTVLRDGRHIDTLPIASAPTVEIVKLMTGEERAARQARPAHRPVGLWHSRCGGWRPWRSSEASTWRSARARSSAWPACSVQVEPNCCAPSTDSTPSPRGGSKSSDRRRPIDRHAG